MRHGEEEDDDDNDEAERPSSSSLPRGEKASSGAPALKLLVINDVARLKPQLEGRRTRLDVADLIDCVID